MEGIRHAVTDSSDVDHGNEDFSKEKNDSADSRKSDTRN